jgi:hypothetical protein
MCESGEIGRRTRFRSWRGNPWGFESLLSHHNLLVDRGSLRFFANGKDFYSGF